MTEQCTFSKPYGGDVRVRARLCCVRDAGHAGPHRDGNGMTDGEWDNEHPAPVVEHLKPWERNSQAPWERNE